RFFFSSRRRHTRFKCNWSSDVCSSDLALSPRPIVAVQNGQSDRREMESALRIHLDSPDLEPIVGALGVAACILKPFEFDLICRKIGRASCRERMYVSVCAEAADNK